MTDDDVARMNGVSCSRRFARGARAAGGKGADHRILGLEGAVAAFALQWGSASLSAFAFTQTDRAEPAPFS
jgi:hypothetical protein